MKPNPDKAEKILQDSPIVDQWKREGDWFLYTVGGPFSKRAVSDLALELEQDAAYFAAGFGPGTTAHLAVPDTYWQMDTGDFDLP